MSSKPAGAQLKLITDSAPEKPESQQWKEIRRDRLINSLNRINFQDGEVVLNFRHSKYNTFLSLPAKPQPCLDNYFECHWTEQDEPDQNYNNYLSENYFFENLYYSDGLKQVFIEAEPVSLDHDGVRFVLPEKALEISSRKIRRHKCCNVDVQLSQDGLVFEGKLVNFSAVSFSITIPHDPLLNIKPVINRNSPASIILKKDDVSFYSGICEIFRKTDSADSITYILQPFKNQTQRFKSKEFRSVRQELNPSPNIIFAHPFTGKNINLKITDVSGSGFSVEERFDNALLLPGMIIPELSIEFMNGMDLKCKCQVIYRTSHDYKTVKCGFAFLDMSIRNQIRLSSFLHQAMNKNSQVCTRINLDDLWSFFFESGFVYPQKYFFIHANKKKFEEVYKKLYENESDLAINFIYQDRGEIYGHMSMFRFYDKTWIINHHAANSAKSSRAGLVVLEQIGRYINEFHRLPSTRMDYVACYFRSVNKFPNLVFGGAARRSSDGCTIEDFAYLHLNKMSLNGSLERPWSLRRASDKDIRELNDHYNKEYGGLTLKALDIDKPKPGLDKMLNDEFTAAGFKRDRVLYSLKYNKELIAVFMVNVTELGMNMSDLTNCIHVFVMNEDRLPSEKLYSCIKRLSKHYEHNNLSVLVYPKSYADNQDIPIDKTYSFWVLDVEKSSDEYFRHINRLTKRAK
jgi:hypothetical protein